MAHALLDEALKMPLNERVELAQQILASLEGEDDAVRDAWVTEVRDRMTAVKQGRAVLKDFDSLYHED